MKPSEFNDRMSKKEKFYDTVSRETVEIILEPDIAGEAYGKTDSGDTIKVFVQNLEATDKQSSDTRTDTEKLADLLIEMGINSRRELEDFLKENGINIRNLGSEPTENDKEEQEFLESYTSALREFINHYKTIGNKYSKRYEGLRNEKGTEKQEDEQMLDAIYEYPTEMLKKVLEVILKDDEYSKKHDEDGIVLVFSKRLQEQGDIDKALELLDSGFTQMAFRIRLKKYYIENILKMREEYRIPEPPKIVPDSIEEATIGEVTAPNFSKAITDIKNAVKETPQQGINKDENDGVTQDDE